MSTCEQGHEMRPTWVTCPRCLPKDPDGYPEQLLMSHSELKKFDDLTEAGVPIARAIGMVLTSR